MIRSTFAQRQHMVTMALAVFHLMIATALADSFIALINVLFQWNPEFYCHPAIPRKTQSWKFRELKCRHALPYHTQPCHASPSRTAPLLTPSHQATTRRATPSPQRRNPYLALPGPTSPCRASPGHATPHPTLPNQTRPGLTLPHHTSPLPQG